MRGGGTAGPRGEDARERAGDPGEYHHSRNLIKKMAVGRRSRSESNSNWGEVTSKRLIEAIIPFRRSEKDLSGDVTFAIR